MYCWQGQIPQAIWAHMVDTDIIIIQGSDQNRVQGLWSAFKLKNSIWHAW